MKAYSAIIAFVITTYTATLSAEPRKVFISDFAFKGFSQTQLKRFSPILGQVLASELQASLSASGALAPATMANLESQLKKKKLEEELECTGEGCVQKIVDNFQISDAIYGVVNFVDADTVQVVLTWTRENNVITGTAGSCPADAPAIMKLVRSLGNKLLAGVSKLFWVDKTVKKELKKPITLEISPSGKLGAYPSLTSSTGCEISCNEASISCYTNALSGSVISMEHTVASDAACQKALKECLAKCP